MTSRNSKSKILFGLSGGEDGYEAKVLQALAKSSVTVEDSNPRGYSPLIKSIVNQLNGGPDSIERIAFDTSPSVKNEWAGVYRPKLKLIPDDVCKRIAIQDSLVSNIVRARQEHVGSFGRPRPDRFSLGCVIAPNAGVNDKLNEQEKEEMSEKIAKAMKLLNTCGHTEHMAEQQQKTFSEFLSLSTRSAVVCGRIATEIIYTTDDAGEKHFHHFASTDSGTIFKAGTDQAALAQVRRAEYDLKLATTGKDKTELVREIPDTDAQYTWVQVIEGQPRAVFTDEELKVYNFYAVPDVELDGYPVTPIDTVISAITTHINIVCHNKLYFQSGRATRGMLVIKSDDVTPPVVHNIKQTFNASINNVNNSWRMPVFGVGTEEDIQWQSLDSAGGRDMEFQYLTDLNAREILTAFMMSPDELPGWSYLSKGTNNQALSESNNEYKLQAARDVGIRPLLHKFEDYINTHLFPLIDPELAKQCRVKLVGLETDNAEKEAVRLQQDMGLWETYDGVLERVEKKPIGKRWGGTLPLNPTIMSYWDKYFSVGEILAEHCDRPEARNDPTLAYRHDEMWFNWQQILDQRQQMQQQQQQAAQAAAAGQPPPGAGGGGGGGSGGPPGGGGAPPQGSAPGGDQPKVQTDKQKAGEETSASGGAQGQGASDMARSIDMAYEAITKSEAALPPDKRKLIIAQRHTVEHFLRGWLEDAKDVTAEILAVAEHHKPKKN